MSGNKTIMTEEHPGELFPPYPYESDSYHWLESLDKPFTFFPARWYSNSKRWGTLEGVTVLSAKEAHDQGWRWKFVCRPPAGLRVVK